MSQMKPQFLAIHDPASVLPIFGSRPEDVLPGYPIQTISTGTPRLMLSSTRIGDFKTSTPRYGSLRSLSLPIRFLQPAPVLSKGIALLGRLLHDTLAHLPDLLEDPFTGSATGGMAAYLWRYGLIDHPQFVAEQGHWLKRSGQATVEVIGPPQDIVTAKWAAQQSLLSTANLLSRATT